MYKLYWSRRTGAFAPQAMLEEIGAEYEKLVIDTDAGAHRTAEFLKINPRGQIPALVLPDGTLLTESTAMVLHIGDCHPEAGLLPAVASAERAQLYRWLLFMSTNIYDAALRYYYSDRYTTDPASAEAVKAAAIRDGDQSWAILATALAVGPYLLGDRFGAGDIYLTMLATWHPDMPGLFAEQPAVKTVFDLTTARPAVARVCAEHA